MVGVCVKYAWVLPELQCCLKSSMLGIASCRCGTYAHLEWQMFSLCTQSLMHLQPPYPILCIFKEDMLIYPPFGEQCKLTFAGFFNNHRSDIFEPLCMTKGGITWPQALVKMSIVVVSPCSLGVMVCVFAPVTPITSSSFGTSCTYSHCNSRCT